jgi:hypothetical protein
VGLEVVSVTQEASHSFGGCDHSVCHPIDLGLSQPNRDNVIGYHTDSFEHEVGRPVHPYCQESAIKPYLSAFDQAVIGERIEVLKFDKIDLPWLSQACQCPSRCTRSGDERSCSLRFQDVRRRMDHIRRQVKEVLIAYQQDRDVVALAAE